MTWYTCNAFGADGHTYAVYVQCETIEQAEHLFDQLELVLDESGVSEMLYIEDRRSN